MLKRFSKCISRLILQLFVVGVLLSCVASTNADCSDIAIGMHFPFSFQGNGSLLPATVGFQFLGLGAGAAGAKGIAAWFGASSASLLSSSESVNSLKIIIAAALGTFRILT